MTALVDRPQRGRRYVMADGTLTTEGLVMVDKIALRVAAMISDGSLDLSEGDAPSAAADQARVYAEDTGAGKTRLMVQFPTGAAQQLAIEP